MLLPFMVTVVVPCVIVYFANHVNIGWSLPSPFNFLLVALGCVSICIGLYLFVVTNYFFITIGKGTLAPWDATKNLVVRGVYRYVRNPMITGVWFVLIGEVLILGLWALFVWLAFFVTANIIWIPLWEEPGLEKRFGENYLLYKQYVPRWIPRLSAWKPPFDSEK
jgi:protein-S-isoprenylcysteine O-methyltransferase Ste14